MNKKIKEMLARKNDLRLKALAVIDQAQKEGRFLTDEEDKNVKQFEEEMRKWDETIKRAEAIGVDDEPAPATDIPPVKPTPQNDEKRFASFGEQMMAVYRSASPDGRIDPRLTTRAASGMSESVPSDGGFLVQQDFVTELLKKTYETGILASKVRKIPISTNANGLKINAVDESSRATAVWYVNQEIEPLLYTLKIGDKPVYIPAGGLSEVPYATLFGRPVMPLEQCSAVGEVGDIILADMSQYLLIDKGGINAASSIHVRFLYDESVFRFIYRVDGQPIWNKPLTPYKGSSSTSPFVALAKRN